MYKAFSCIKHLLIVKCHVNVISRVLYYKNTLHMQPTTKQDYTRKDVITFDARTIIYLECSG